jgi:DNA-binding NarL/FixJ family response regulator
MPMKFMLIDDHAMFREGVALLLRPLVQPLEIWEAGSCEEAFVVFDQRGQPDVVLIDLALPGMSGIEGLRVLHERFPETPLVALSSSDDRASVLEALDAGAMGFIPKSSTSDVMRGALTLILAKGIYLPPKVFLNTHPALVPQGALARTVPEAAGTSAAARETPRPTCRPSDLSLTPRQADVLYQILQGKSIKVISREMKLSPSTVKSHTSVVLRALNVTTRTQAVVAAGRIGLCFDDAPPVGPAP